MERPASWKIVVAGAALTGLGVLGAGAAGADSGPGDTSATTSIDMPFFDLSGADQSHTVAMDDDTFWSPTSFD